MKTKSVLVDGYQSVINNGRNHSIVTDLPTESNGQDIGATALELSVMSLAGCISTIFKKVADKMRLNVSNLEVETDAEKGQDTISKVKCAVYVTSDAAQEKLEKCLDNTMKTCPVGILYEKAGVEITTELNKR
jgi:putative redox protein